LISSVMDTKDKVPFFVAQANQMGIEILPPDVNLSDHQFVVVDGNIRFGLDAVKGVGFSAGEAIKRAREEQPFTDLFDFCERIDNRAVNRKAIEGLIKCGAFGSTGDSRKGMLAVLEQAQSAGQKAQQDAQIGQGSIFDLMPAEPATGGSAGTGGRPTHVTIPAGEFEKTELLALEKEAIGLFISEHPLKAVATAMSLEADYTLGELHQARDGDRVIVGGIINQSRKLKTRTGNWMMFATLEDLTGSVDLTIFNETMEECAEALEPDSIVLVKGKFEQKDQRGATIVVSSVAKFAPTQEDLEAAEVEAKKVPSTALRLRLDPTAVPASMIGELRDLLVAFPGESEVVIELSTSRGARKLRLGPDYKVARSAGLYAELDQLLGGAMIAAETPVPAAAGAAA
jgi:DNA polymerase III subunit alpha